MRLLCTPFEVRDYECDLQGIVNHAVYLHYMEHSRHLYLKTLGGDFAALHADGLDLVVAHADIHYKAPLRSGDRFEVHSEACLKGIARLVFTQSIYRTPVFKEASDASSLVPKNHPELVTKGVFTIAGIREGRPVRLDSMFSVLIGQEGSVAT